MSHRTEDMKFLIELLDDENDQSACTAMAELLKYGEPLSGCLSQLKTEGNPRLKRRVQQLQFALKQRTARRTFAADLAKDEVPLFRGLLQLHLTWYDNDTQEEVMTQWDELKESYRKFAPDNLKELSEFLSNRFSVVTSSGDFSPELYCLGAVLDENLSSDLIVCAIAAILTAGQDQPLRLFHSGPNFAIVDRSGSALYPSGWQIENNALSSKQASPVWTTHQILKYIESMLFLAAAASDGFRYIYTLGHPIAAELRKPDLSFLPYPYNIGKPDSGSSD